MDYFDSFLSENRKLPREQPLLVPCTGHMCRLLLVYPATTSTAGQSFSTAKRIKTWMRSKVIPVRFNAFSILHTHKTLKEHCKYFFRKKWKKAFNFWPILNLKKKIFSNIYNYFIYFKCKMQILNDNFSQHSQRL